jgi:hypothetical protein
LQIEVEGETIIGEMVKFTLSFTGQGLAMSGTLVMEKRVMAILYIIV